MFGAIFEKSDFIFGFLNKTLEKSINFIKVVWLNGKNLFGQRCMKSYGFTKIIFFKIDDILIFYFKVSVIYAGRACSASANRRAVPAANHCRVGSADSQLLPCLCDESAARTQWAADSCFQLNML